MYSVVCLEGKEVRQMAGNLGYHEAEELRDKLNKSAAEQGIRYADCRYAVRVGSGK
jgi:hypothetical protein